MLIIELKFDKTITSLAGNPYGRKVFQEQVKKKIDYSDQCIIVFPEQIVRIASSFVQGFFKEIVDSIGLSNFDNQIIIKGNKRVIESIKENI